MMYLNAAAATKHDTGTFTLDGGQNLVIADANTDIVNFGANNVVLGGHNLDIAAAANAHTVDLYGNGKMIANINLAGNDGLALGDVNDGIFRITNYEPLRIGNYEPLGTFAFTPTTGTLTIANNANAGNIVISEAASVTFRANVNGNIEIRSTGTLTITGGSVTTANNLIFSNKEGKIILDTGSSLIINGDVTSDGSNIIKFSPGSKLKFTHQQAPYEIGSSDDEQFSISYRCLSELPKIAESMVDKFSKPLEELEYSDYSLLRVYSKHNSLFKNFLAKNFDFTESDPVDDFISSHYLEIAGVCKDVSANKASPFAKLPKAILSHIFSSESMFEHLETLSHENPVQLAGVDASVEE